jgi:hypothetical protein
MEKNMKKQKPKKYNAVNTNDGNETFEVEAYTVAEAQYKALEELGWFISEGDAERDE